MQLSRETQLLDRIDALAAERDYWKSEALGKQDVQAQGLLTAAFKLSRAQGWLLWQLYAARGKLIKWQYLDEYMPGRISGEDRETNVVKVQIHRIRKQIGPANIVTTWGVGCSLAPEGVTKCDKILERLAQ